MIFLFSSIGAPSVDVYFSPENNVRSHILTVLGRAKKSVDVAMFSFTDRRLAQKMVAISKRLKVRVLLDPKNASDNPYSKAGYLSNNGVNIRYAKVMSVYGIEGIMHNKFAVIDGKIVLTGSYNWTASANSRNNENMLIIRNKRIGAIYEKEFSRLWKNGTKEIERKLPVVVRDRKQIEKQIGKTVILEGKIRKIRKGRSAAFVYFAGIARFKVVVFDMQNIPWKPGDNVRFIVLIEKSNRYGLEGIFQRQGQ